MNLLDTVTNFFTGNTGPLISGAASLVGGLMGNQQRSAQAQRANEFSAQQFATRYQTTVKDMQAAGLNPMLAYSQGGGSPPSGVQAQQDDVISPAVNAFNQTRSTNIQNQLSSAQINNINADTANKGAQANLLEAQALRERATAYQVGTQGAVNERIADEIKERINKIIAETSGIKAQTDKTKTETPERQDFLGNYRAQGLVLMATVDELNAAVDKMKAQKLTESDVQAQLKALAAKLVSETDLNKLDIEAAKNFANLGRNWKEVQPIFDILKFLIKGK